MGESTETEIRSGQLVAKNALEAAKKIEEMHLNAIELRIQKEKTIQRL
ncbi:MAG: hypothetical protein ACO29Z_08275 [Crocinitomicaceae bacterium]